MNSKQKRQPGELESLVLGCLWDAEGALSSQEVQAQCSKQGELALTTVLTVLSRLEDKGLVARESESGRTLFFRAVESREEHTARVMLSMLDEETNPTLAFSHFAKGLTKAQKTALKKILGE
jgi:predicted transcriptional regulator